MGKLDGKVSIVTGGAQGIGKSIALSLAAEGADILIGDVLIDGAEETAAEICKLGRKSKAIKLDVTDPESAKEMAKFASKEFGRIDHLINNAGITRDNLMMRMKQAEWDMVIAVNLTGVFNCTQAVMRYMMKQRYGRVVNISSVIGQMGNAGQVNYASTKAGVIGMTKSVARELGSRNVTVNAITPGYIETEMTHVLTEEQKEAMLSTIPLNRAGKPEDIAKAVNFLVSDDAAYITGAVINVNGGMYM